ncbi:VOC family protein [Halalkalibacter sp. APA_J-10(15)]|uniref:VOC family protein n=1 Tax=Halalkalibacter sp. APA_J-10(15) TaxID=2933805 RepID=UPI001FF14E71|nr:VOC family protein [Halalkalibacter sp. APA_J-10(15)]MCK0471049.1 VOC family protein [Halalkalibacter sp. APA_J-10(15)]
MVESPSLFSRVGYVYMPTTNMDESIRWYEENLGFTLEGNKFRDGSNDFDVAVLMLPEGNTVVLLVEIHNQSFENQDKTVPTLALTCPDLQSTHHMLQERGVDVSEIIVRSEDAKYFIIKDPSGNVIEAAWSIWD